MARRVGGVRELSRRSELAFGQARAALEQNGQSGLNKAPQGVGDPVVLLDEGFGNPNIVGHDSDQVPEVATVVEEFLRGQGACTWAARIASLVARLP